MKKTLLAIALAAATTTAFADTTLSGHINYAAGDLEDFSGNEDFVVQNANSSQSRFRIKADKEAGGITYGIYLEHGLVDSGVNRRVDEFFIKGGFGKLTLGQGSEAGDGATEADFSGTYLGNGAAYNTWTDPSITQVDGGRDERLRYDSPKLGPVSLAIDYDTNDNVGAAISAGGKFWKLGAFVESKDADDSDEVGASVAFKFAGVTLALQAGQIDGADDSTDSLDYTKTIVGYRTGAFSVAVDYATNERDAVAGGTGAKDTETLGLTFVYRPTKGVELYAGLRESTDNEATATSSVFANNEEDASGFLFGGRVRF